MKQLIAVIVLGVIGGNIVLNSSQYNKDHPLVYEAQAEEPQEILIATTTEWTKEKIKDRIRATFPENPETMIKVAECESGIQNIPGRLSDDGGIFQINITHQKELDRQELDRYDIEDNIKFARYLYDNGGLGHWKASKSCWSK